MTVQEQWPLLWSSAVIAVFLGRDGGPHPKTLITCHYTGWFIGILIMAYDNPYIIGWYNPLYTLNQQDFFRGSCGVTNLQFHTSHHFTNAPRIVLPKQNTSFQLRVWWSPLPGLAEVVKRSYFFLFRFAWQKNDKTDSPNGEIHGDESHGRKQTKTLKQALVLTVDGWNPKQPPGMYETL